VFKLVRANPAKMTVIALIGAVRCQIEEGLLSEGLIASVIWSMIDCGQLEIDFSKGISLGPCVPKLRKK